MARLPRVVVPGSLHLIVHTGHGHRPVFDGAASRERYLGALRDAAREAQVGIHAYGLLDHELRLLATPSDKRGLATLIQSVDRRYVRYLNRGQGSVGSPWAGRFRSAVVEAETHYKECLRFVELPTPLEPGGSGPPGVWASTRHHLGLEPNELIVEHPAFWSFGNTPFEREAAYRRFAEQDAQPARAAILRSALRGWVVGSHEFAQRIQNETGRRVLPRSSGRPAFKVMCPQ